MLVRLGPFDNRDAFAPQFREQTLEIIDAIINHEARLARAKRLAVPPSHVPDGRAAIGTRVFRPLQERAAPGFKHEPKVTRVPSRELLLIRLRFEEHAPNSSDSCHGLPYQTLDAGGTWAPPHPTHEPGWRGSWSLDARKKTGGVTTSEASLHRHAARPHKAIAACEGIVDHNVAQAAAPNF